MIEAERMGQPRDKIQALIPTWLPFVIILFMFGEKSKALVAK
jgi:hypothetical protein